MGVCALLASCSKVDNDPKVIVITFDGLRWQEVFTGADSALVSDPRPCPIIPPPSAVLSCILVYCSDR